MKLKNSSGMQVILLKIEINGKKMDSQKEKNEYEDKRLQIEKSLKFPSFLNICNCNHEQSINVLMVYMF